MEQYYLGFDAGTQSVKVAVYDENMTCVAKAVNKTTIDFPQPGWVNMDADEYFELTKKGMHDCANQLKKKNISTKLIKSIMGDGIICGIVGVDEEGKAITPYINYLDSRTQSDVDYINNLDLSIWGEETGNPEASCMFPAMHARWFLSNDENFREKGSKFMHNAPYILSRLAGLTSKDAFVDWGTMSGWGLGYHVHEKKWSDRQLEILGIDKKYLPKIVKPWDIIGTLSEDIAKEVGFEAGIPICAGAGDTMQSLLGSGVSESGKAVDVAGTCAMFCVSTDGIIAELSKKGNDLIFNSGTLEGTYFYWGFVRTGGLSLRWFKDNICKNEDDKYYEVLSEKAKNVQPGCNGVLFLPYLTGGYGEYSNIKAGFLNMDLDTDRYVLWRAVLEAIGYDYLEVINTYRNKGINIDRITITEGGSRDNLWNQIKADMMNSEAITLETSGGAVVTNCIIGAYAVGAVSDLKEALSSNIKITNKYIPNSTNTSIYKKQYQVKNDILDILKKI
ncbi:FGGY family carbohydrate kinase [Clostridium aestuarii]|uniref:FGGY family carbohydrate kinase n=1 Tax=Clostridium aestuarii TaxID=338193 RepID=A0ABT4D2P8_9CLOT|nr:FGGY family carbohydrate kinase [Clostridium aestuarii]MCY6485523.1 FGGY family carbohydrate kinase [Clostridium aestuarii]